MLGYIFIFMVIAIENGSLHGFRNPYVPDHHIGDSGNTGAPAPLSQVFVCGHPGTRNCRNRAVTSNGALLMYMLEGVSSVANFIAAYGVSHFLI